MPKEFMLIDAKQQQVMAASGLNLYTVYRDPRINVWRSLADRENGLLDFKMPDGQPVRLHVKRYAATSQFMLPAHKETRGYHGLLLEGIPTAQLVAWGALRNRRSFVIFRDLAGYTPADKLIEAGFPFEQLLIPTADLVAKLHSHKLHHRDLYLCHFMVNRLPTGDMSVAASAELDIRIIDTTRIGRLTNIFTRRRWTIKDLGQFWYSTTKLNITDDQRTRWLARYAEQRQLKPESFRRSIERKSRDIAHHDARLNKKQPNRNVSIPIK